MCRQSTYTRDDRLSYLDLGSAFDVTRVESVDTPEGLHGSEQSAIEVRYSVSLLRTGHSAGTMWKFDQLNFSDMAQIAHLVPWCMTTSGSGWSPNYEL